jgi:hypothetical protein
MNLDGMPWFEPPEWWLDGMIDGLTWEELLLREWRTALMEPPSPRELEGREMARQMGEAAALSQQEIALRILTDPE